MRPGKVRGARSTGLKLFATKEVDQRFIRQFWRNWKNPKKARKLLLPKTPWKRMVLRLSPTTLATVRRFLSPKEAKKYMENTRLIEKTIMGEKPKHFVLQPVQFFSRKGNLLLERVYRGPYANFFLNSLWKSQPRYLRALKRRLKRKGIDLEDKQQYLKISEIVDKAFSELRQIELVKIPIGIQSVNLLFLDFDPKTEKVLFAITDHGKPPSIKEQ